MTQLLVGAACSSLPEGAPILDAMAGTGIVSRILSERFRVSTNDANAFLIVEIMAFTADLIFNRGMVSCCSANGTKCAR